MNQLPSNVEFVVSAENVHKVVTLLLSNEITFTLRSFHRTENTQKTITAPFEIPNESKADAGNGSMNPIVPVLEAIYLKYIKQQIEQFPPMEVQIAAEFGISLKAFKNGFKAFYGKPFYQLHLEKRIQHAKTLLLMGHKSTEVAKRFGYSQTIKFNVIFQKHVGVTPKQFQLDHQVITRTNR